MLWTTLTEKAAEAQLPLSTIAAEALHLAILEGLFGAAESAPANFQGGTAIHLLHGGYRFSEDLDFAGADLTWPAAEVLINKAQPGTEKLVTQMLGLGRHSWQLPPAKKKRRIYAAWYSFQPQGQQQKFHVKIECAHYPVYQPQPLAVRSSLDVLQRMPLVSGLPARELLTEKITAVLGRAYVKGRDLFDLWYFREILRTPIEAELLRTKLSDYQVSWTKKAITAKLKNYSHEALAREMRNFLPMPHRRLLEKDGFRAIRLSAEKVMNEAMRIL
jgi:predicted nucleotidyltransferase component of viral defense system